MEPLRNFLARIQGIGMIAPFVLRLVIGGVFAYHGYQKFDGGIDGVEMMFESVDAPAAAFTAPLVSVVEIVAGVALFVGAVTRLAALVLMPVLIGAIILVKTDIGVIASMGEPPGAELDLALLAGLFAVLILGPGPVSVDRAVGLEPPMGARPADQRPAATP